MKTFLVKRKLFGKMQESSEKQMTELVQNDEYIDSKDLFDRKAGLMKTATKWYTDTVKVLVGRGDDVELEDKYVPTGLMQASHQEGLDVVCSLFSHQTDIDQQNCNKNTTLKEQKDSFWGMVEEVKKSLSAKKTTGNVDGRLHCYPYEQLVMTPHNKKIFDELLKLGSIATVFDSETIDTYDKLKSVYKQLNDHMKDQTIKKQIQSAFIRKQNQLSH